MFSRWIFPVVLAAVLLLVNGVDGRKALGSDDWDYIVVGAGAAGCAVAAGLAQDGSKVLVLEAGHLTAWKFGGRDQQEYFTKFGGQTEVTVHDVPGEGLGLQSNSKYWWENVPWGAQGVDCFPGVRYPFPLLQQGAITEHGWLMDVQVKGWVEVG